MENISISKTSNTIRKPMVYTYLLNLYQALDNRQQEIEVELSRLIDDKEQFELIHGRLAAINEFRSFIHNKYHSKLPRRIQKLHQQGNQ